MKFTSTGSSKYETIIRNNRTLKAQVVAALRAKPATSFELEDGLNRLHQSVSSTLTRLVQEGTVVVDGYAINQHGNWVNVYRIKGK